MPDNVLGDEELKRLLDDAKKLAKMAKDDGDMKLSMAFLDQGIGVVSLRELKGIHAELRWIRRIMQANVPVPETKEDGRES